MAKLGVLLAAAPDSPGGAAGLRLATEAARQGHDTYMYLVDDGARHVAAAASALAGYTQAGGKLFICAYSCQKRGLPASGIADATYCGLVLAADIVRNCDRFLCFAR